MSVLFYSVLKQGEAVSKWQKLALNGKTESELEQATIFNPSRRVEGLTIATDNSEGNVMKGVKDERSGDCATEDKP
jgi:hypothetical protein